MEPDVDDLIWMLGMETVKNYKLKHAAAELQSENAKLQVQVDSLSTELQTLREEGSTK